jgi:predicted PurR-regulated permease PerM
MSRLKEEAPPTPAQERAAAPVSPAEELPAPFAPDRRFARHLSVITLALLFVVLVIYLLDRLSSILQPLFVAAFILYALFPLKSWLKRFGMKSWLAYTIILSCVLALFVTLGSLGYSNLGRLSPEVLGKYEKDLDQQLTRAVRATGIELDSDIQVRQLLHSEEALHLRLRSTLMSMSGTFFGFLGVAALVVVYLFFLLLELAEFPDRVREAFSPERANGALDIFHQINEALGHYVSVMAFISLLQGGLSAVVLGVAGVDFFLLWGLIIALFNFVPYIGLIGVAMPIVFTFVQYPNEPARGVTVLVLLAGIQAVVDNVVSPRMTGHKLGVSPLLVLLSLAFWGWLWGIVGIILAVPLTVTIKIILEHIPATKPIAVLMRDK